MKYFFDTSALAKRYITEKGSDIVNDLFVKSSGIYVSIICLPELFSALNRLKREGALTQSQYEGIKLSIVDEFKHFQVCEFSPTIIAQTVSLLEQFPLRSLDALHLACFMQTRNVTFVSSDQQQVKTVFNLKLKFKEV